VRSDLLALPASRSGGELRFELNCPQSIDEKMSP
jgi:hypothetical protein